MIRLYTCFIISLFLFSCGDAPQKKPKENVINHNYIVVLDLSDRILVPNQVSRDIELINFLYEQFLSKVQKSFYINSKDNFKVVIPYQKEALASSRISIIEDELYVNMESIPLREKKDIKESADEFSQNLTDLYSLAKISDDPNDYKGADIHGYLRDNLQFDLSIDPETENKLIIITDGYMYVEDKSPGIDDWGSVADLSNIQVAILEINPSKAYDNEFSRIENAWSSWMKKMNSQEVLIFPQSAMSKVKEGVSRFFFDNVITTSIAPNTAAKVKSSINQTSSQSGSKEKKIITQNDSSILLKEGNYYANIKGKLRTIVIKNLSINDDKVSFKYDYKPYGNDLKNLNGSILSDNVNLGKLGTFKLSKNDDYLILTNTEDGSLYKRLNDED